MFVSGLILSRKSRACEAGLKSARLAYVDNAMSGRKSDCGVVLDKDLMAGVLDAAADQVSVYCENTLLGALRRELTSLTSP